MTPIFADYFEGFIGHQNNWEPLNIPFSKNKRFDFNQFQSAEIEIKLIVIYQWNFPKRLLTVFANLIFNLIFNLISS
jgi:hypothetical protein